jgi:hypothetical protein
VASPTLPWVELPRIKDLLKPWRHIPLTPNF